MQKILTVDAALAILIEAKNKVGGDAPLVLSLTDSELADQNVNNMEIIDVDESQYVEVQVKHSDLAD